MKTLKLEKRGCDFWSDEPVKSDINNYRVCTSGETIKGKDGKKYFLEFSLWRNKGRYRTTNKRNGKSLKKPVFEVDVPNGIHTSTQYTDNKGSWSNLKLEIEMNAKNYTYTTDSILKIVNSISKNKYDKIVFI